MGDRFRSLVFDLDGTLIETAPDLCGALNHVLERLGRPLLSLQQVRPLIGDGARALLARGLAEDGVPAEVLDADLARGLPLFMDYYLEHVAEASAPFPQIVELLRHFRSEGRRLAVCTNKATGFTERLLAELEMDDLFDAVVCGDSLPVRKPDPGHLVGTIEALGGDPATAVMIGDSANDLNAARGAGVPVVLVSFGYTRVPARELGADAVIDHFRELPPALAALS